MVVVTMVGMAVLLGGTILMFRHGQGNPNCVSRELALNSDEEGEFKNFAAKYSGLYSRLFASVEQNDVSAIRKNLTAWGVRTMALRAAAYSGWWKRNFGDVASMSDETVKELAANLCRLLIQHGLEKVSGPCISSDDMQFAARFIVENERVGEPCELVVIEPAWLLNGRVVEKGVVQMK